MRERTSGFKCPTCGKATGVTDTRWVKMEGSSLSATYRRRECTDGHRFTTYELPVPAIKDALLTKEQAKLLLTRLTAIREEIRDFLVEAKGFNLPSASPANRERKE